MGKRKISSLVPVLLSNQQDVAVKGKGTARRKLELQTNTSEGKNMGENDLGVQNPPLTQYEKDRIGRIKENDQVLKSFGIEPLVASMKQHASHHSKGKGKDHDGPEEEEYNPEKEGDVESEDMSERIEAVKAKKFVQGPRTRSRANAAAEIELKSTHAATTTGNKEPRKVAIETEKEVTSSYRAPVLKPTRSKLFKQSTNGEAPGSTNAYLAMRECQKQNIVSPTLQDAPELNVEETTDEVIKAAPRKPRGRTKMAKVHARSGDGKVVITLNALGQPVSDNPKILTELSNFVGKLAKDNVSLTYVNWHLVPDQLKKEMWEYTRGRYVISDEGEKWVYKTLNDAWRVHKSRMKGKHYKGYKTDEERIRNRPDEIALEDFKILLKYWGDEEVEKLAKDSSDRRNSFTDTHTMGPKTLAQVRYKMKKIDPKHDSPSNAKVYLETRKREPGRKYKTNTDSLEKITKIKKMLGSGQEAEAAVMLTKDKDSGKSFLVGRRGKATASTSAPAHTDEYVQELTAKIKLDLESELEAKVNREVQKNMTWVLKKLGDVNLNLKLDIVDFCATFSSEQDDNGSPMTEGGTSLTQGRGIP